MKNFIMRTLVFAFLLGTAFMASGNAIAPPNHTESSIFKEHTPLYDTQEVFTVAECEHETALNIEQSLLVVDAPSVISAVEGSTSMVINYNDHLLDGQCSKLISCFTGYTTTTGNDIGIIGKIGYSIPISTLTIASITISKNNGVIDRTIFPMYSPPKTSLPILNLDSRPMLGIRGQDC